MTSILEWEEEAMEIERAKEIIEKRRAWYENLELGGLQFIKLKEAEALFGAGKYKTGLVIYHKAVNRIIRIIDALDKKLRSERRKSD